MSQTDFETTLLGDRETLPSRSDLSKLLLQRAGEYLEANYDKLYCLCLGVIKDPELATEALNAVVYFQLPGLCERWAPERGNFDGYAMYSLGLKLLTWKQSKQKKRYEQFDTEVTPQEFYATDGNERSVEDGEIVNLALDLLEPYSRWLVVARVVDEMGFEEMAEKLNVAKGTAFNHFQRAFITFREHVKELEK